MARHLWETENRECIQKLADFLQLPAERLRPCFVRAWRWECADRRSGGVRAEAIGFFATELKVLGIDAVRSERVMRDWTARNGGWPAEKLHYAVTWPHRKRVNNRYGCPRSGAGGNSKTRHFCVGTENCAWLKKRGWERDQGAKLKRYQTRHSLLREGGWYAMFPPGSVEDKVYTMLCRFEAKRNLEPGQVLYFSQQAARDTAMEIWSRAMRNETVSAALERLQEVGLVELVSGGARGSRNPRKVRRAIERNGRIPICPGKVAMTVPI